MEKFKNGNLTENDLDNFITKKINDFDNSLPKIVDKLSEFHDILTPEQREDFITFLYKMKERRENRKKEFLNSKEGYFAEYKKQIYDEINEKFVMDESQKEWFNALHNEIDQKRKEMLPQKIACMNEFRKQFLKDKMDNEFIIQYIRNHKHLKHYKEIKRLIFINLIELQNILNEDQRAEFVSILKEKMGNCKFWRGCGFMGKHHFIS